MKYFNSPHVKSIRLRKNRHYLTNTSQDHQQSNMKIEKDTTHPFRNIKLTCQPIQARLEDVSVL